MVEYKYNAWGTQLSRTGELANTLGYANPFRYRGYIYDDETWMYWLRSRYYYPELHRFINADELLGVVGGLTTHNAYAYCANAPVDRADHSGYFAAKTLSEDEDGIPGPTNSLSGGASSMAILGAPASGVETIVPAEAGKSRYGHYRIWYNDGAQYIGKGSLSRCKISINQHTEGIREFVKAVWYSDISEPYAFMSEAASMMRAGYGSSKGHPLLNKIWSPGKKLMGQYGLSLTDFDSEYGDDYE